MKTVETTQRLWVSENGDVLCDDHAGIYLKESIKASPKARHHETPLDTWDMYYSNLLKALPCMVCVDWTTLEMSS